MNDRVDTNAVRRLVEAATTGPWRVDDEWWIDERPSALPILGGGAPRSLSEHCCALVSDYGQGVEECEATAEFIAAARTLVPRLCDEVDRLRAERDLAIAEMSDVQERCDGWEKRAHRAEARVATLEAALREARRFVGGGPTRDLIDAALGQQEER